MKKYFTSKDARQIISTYKFAIFPIHGVKEDGSCTCNNESCANIGKHPATPDGFKSASNDIERVKKLWASRKGLNVGIATGEKSGIFVVDIDSREGEQNLRALGTPPKTLTVKTGKGYHLYFKYPDKPVITKKGILEGVDVRGDGGYVAGPGSNHASGITYDFVNPLEEIAEAPDFILDLVLKERTTGTLLNLTTNKLNLFTDQGWSLDDIRAHLEHIDPDIGYDEWIKVGMALHQEGVPFYVWDEWSSGGSKYDNSAGQHWKSFKPGGGVTYGTVVAYAKQGGWEPKQKATAITIANASRTYMGLNIEIIDEDTGEIQAKTFPLIYASDVTAVTEVNDFVEDLLCENQFSVVYGESNCGKTFYMLDLSMHVALGKRWRDKDVDQGGVIYAALEGGHGTKNRIAAFKKHYNIIQEIPLAVIPSSINFLDADNDIQYLINTIEEAKQRLGDVKLIVIDTLARAMSGADENAGTDMGSLIANADLIRSITNAHICFIHHSGKDAVKGARGHSSLRAAVDTELEVSRVDELSPSQVKVVKQREIEMIEAMHFTLDSVSIGVSAKKNKEITSCIVQTCEAAETPNAIRMTDIQKFIFDSLIAAVLDHGAKRTIREHSVLCVTYDEFNAALEANGYKEFMETENKSTAEQVKSSTQSARVALKRHNKIEFNRDYLWIVNPNDLEEECKNV